MLGQLCEMGFLKALPAEKTAELRKWRFFGTVQCAAHSALFEILCDVRYARRPFPSSRALSRTSRLDVRWLGQPLCFACRHPTACFDRLRGDTVIVHSTVTYHTRTSTQLVTFPLWYHNSTHYDITTPHAPTYSLTQDPGWNWNPITVCIDSASVLVV